MRCRSNNSFVLKTNELNTELNAVKEGVEVEITYSVDKTGNPENGGD